MTIGDVVRTEARPGARRTHAAFGAAGIPAVLVAIAVVGWWWSARSTGDSGDGMGMGMAMDEPMSLVPFLVAWVAMMAAMMFPAIAPVVRLYNRASAQGRVAPLPFFVFGYLLIWSAIGLPSYWAWRALMGPLEDARPWAGRLAGAILVAAAVWQLTPLKSVCLRHCRSPLSLFLRARGNLTRPVVAIRMGVGHGAFCLGCCWALMAVLVGFGTMNLGWMAAIAAVIFLEKNWRFGERFATAAAACFAVLGVLLLIHPSTISTLT